MLISSMDSRLHLIVHGTVQGVFYRSNTEKQAKKLSLKGWVMNKSDGSVEIIAEGDRQALERLAEWCSHGPEGASVERIEKEWLDAAGEFTGFSIRY